jgi:hypothetical protein
MCPFRADWEVGFEGPEDRSEGKGCLGVCEGEDKWKGEKANFLVEKEEKGDDLGM